ncbi:hypothetical protein [Novosphingobium kaempferiae]|uniref:hypothetical protein n=1 Tax=Novosphingobium kaempferiae TaxID=2896849 RepID=UPI001E2960F2|nr:hypothetical protein [Novosphingobium kaempferiae]
MGGAASLDSDQAWRQVPEEREQLGSAQRFADNDLACCVYAVNLENILGHIQADRGNLHGEWFLCSGLPYSKPSWHLDAASGSHPSHPLSRSKWPKSERHYLAPVKQAEKNEAVRCRAGRVFANGY